MKKPILFVSAEPRDAVRLRVGEESREIHQTLQRGRKRDDFDFQQRQAVQPGDLIQALLDLGPWIVHFAGHGLRTGELCFENARGETEAIRPGPLARLFGEFSNQVDCVILNACYSKSQAQAIARHIPHVIGIRHELSDEAAIAFVSGFYRGLAAGRPIESCYTLGLTQMDFRGIPEELAPLLITREAETRHAGVTEESRAPESPAPRTRTAPPSRRPSISITTASAAGRRVEEPEPPPPRPEHEPGEEKLHEKDGTVLVYVPGGEYVLGAAEHEWTRPVHRVRLSPFWIARCPVTNAQYERFLADHPEHPEPAFWNHESFNQSRQPVVGVSWEDARAYCRWAGLELPSEARWEAAARGRDELLYPWGHALPSPETANFAGKIGRPTPVGSFPAGAGPYGTLDQAGNVSEWCADEWHSAAYKERTLEEPDPVARGDNAMRVVRGGSWIHPADELQAAYRHRSSAKLRLKIQGFRCVWQPPS